ncbi:MAG: putative beta-lysine N-acetyltransferase [Spirochaetes bacterium]|jgi:putative beta-lysine N-acetyltransferase|nr:putative beta-lysine N-acetyltransferase [Spirochaetota bacterium]
MNDVVEMYRKSLIQHGKDNDRVYVMKCGPNDAKPVAQYIKTLVADYDYSKIFVKCPRNIAQPFLTDDYTIEAAIPGFYGNEECLFLAKFLSPERETVSLEKRELIDAILAEAERKAGTGFKGKTDPTLRELTADDAVALTELYRQVFQTYPFPIFDPVYITETMKSHIVYYGLFQKGRLVSASSAEMDIQNSSVEMTDFATLPDFRGSGTALKLLHTMEEAMRKRSIRNSFTIARSYSYGMNITFSKAGYHFGGTLINNTNISGTIESMNVWYKQLDAPRV